MPVPRRTSVKYPAWPSRELAHCLSRVPAALPVCLENQYFVLDMESDAAREMLDQGGGVFYVPSLLGELELELFAVLRS